MLQSQLKMPMCVVKKKYLGYDAMWPMIDSKFIFMHNFTVGDKNK